MPVGSNQNLPISGNWTAPPTAPGPSGGVTLPWTGWTASADSVQAGSEANKVFDSNPGSLWHTLWSPQAARMPHNLIIDMKKPCLVSGLYYLPRQDGSLNGTIGNYQVEVCLKEWNWITVAAGTWTSDHTSKQTAFNPEYGRYVRLSAYSEAQGQNYQWTCAAEVRVLSNALARDQWTVSASSQDTVDANKLAQSAVDGDVSSTWHTVYHGTMDQYPHYFKIDQGRKVAVSGLSYLPRQDGFKEGRIGRYMIQYSNDQNNWITAATGTWQDTINSKTAYFSAVIARYFRLVAQSEAGNRGPWATASEINLIDGTRQLNNFSSMDFATFAMSRGNFIERYLIPKLRILNSAMEACCQGLAVKIYTSDGGSIAHWEW